MSNPRNCCIFLLLSFISLNALALEPDSCALCKSKKPSSLFLFTAGYRMPVNKNAIINSGHGFYFEGGINAGRLISKTSVVGLYAGWAWKDGLWSTHFNNEFVKDYNASLNKEASFSSLDSAIISTASQLIGTKKGSSVTMPGCEMRSFHNYSLYYGVMVKLPGRFAPIVKVYTGSTRSHYQGGGNLVAKNTDYAIFQIRRAMYGCELMLFKGFPRSSGLNVASFSVYYERCDFYNATLYYDDGERSRSISLKKYAAPSFLTKYKNEMTWGLKLACTVF
jgi:hypothetical protein